MSAGTDPDAAKLLYVCKGCGLLYTESHDSDKTAPCENCNGKLILVDLFYTLYDVIKTLEDERS